MTINSSIKSFKVCRVFVNKGDKITFLKRSGLYFTKNKKYLVENTNELGLWVIDDNRNGHFHHWDKVHNKFTLYAEDKQ